MSQRARKLYNQLSAKTVIPKSPVVAKEAQRESLSDYMVDQTLSFIPKSKFLDQFLDRLNNGKVYRITRR